MERLLLGDNQFFGVNHMSEEKARAQAMRFQDVDAVMDVLDTAYDEGIRTFMCTTHERIAEVAERVRADRERYADFLFYPGMPYAHPTVEHFTPLFVTLGAATDPSAPVTTTVRGYFLGLAKRSFEAA